MLPFDVMKKIILTILLLLTFNTSFGEIITRTDGQGNVSVIYTWTDPEGRVHVSNQSPGKVKIKKPGVSANADSRGTHNSSDVGRKVVMYSTDWCPYCKRARKYFHDNHIRFTDHDIEKDSAANRIYKQLGGSGVPLILVDDRKLQGFSEERFESLYGK